MKVRWTNHSIRLRITPTEMALLQDGKAISAALALPGGAWQAFAVPHAPMTNLSMTDGVLRMALTKADIDALSVPDAEGIYFSTDSVPSVRFLVEKDFPCIHPHGGKLMEAPTETFDAPPDFEERKAG